MATTGSERGLTMRSPGRFVATAHKLRDLYRKRGSPTDTATRDRIVEGWIDAEAYRLSTYSTVARLEKGESIGPISSAIKVFWSELDVRLHESALNLLGPDAEADSSGWMKGYQFALAGPIYAGTNEIQRNVVAERVLGLPRK
jgi:alkylation response protein AidB-like acyl-CoA dehydrogenase